MMRMLHAIATLLTVATTAVLGSNVSSLCGEQLVRHTGFLDGLYYVLYESSSKAVPQDIPLVLWLSGGPGCSGLVGALFELGPCTFDDEANKMQLNDFSWTNHAHVVFIDQPHGTGFSTAFQNPILWTEDRAMGDLADFVDAFFKQYPSLRHNDFFIFGESYGGHYAPDLGATLVKRDASWRSKIKGVGIGNGVVSPIANLQTYLDFATTNKYSPDLIGNLEQQMREQQQVALTLSQDCLSAMRVESQERTRRRIRAQALDNAVESEEDYPLICRKAASASTAFEALALQGIALSARNMYDLRRTCHMDDPLGMCYRFSLLEDYVNNLGLDYFGVPGHKWSLCSSTVMRTLLSVEFIEQSDTNVAFLLENGVRVLVYAGDSDVMAHWNMQDRWTHDLEWPSSDVFRRTPLRKLTLGGRAVGEVRSANGLSLVRVYESGHMVPRDQPSVALEMLRSFTQQSSHATPVVFT